MIIGLSNLKYIIKEYKINTIENKIIKTENNNDNNDLYLLFLNMYNSGFGPIISKLYKNSIFYIYFI